MRKTFSHRSYILDGRFSVDHLKKSFRIRYPPTHVTNQLKTKQTKPKQSAIQTLYYSEQFQEEGIKFTKEDVCICLCSKKIS